MPYSIKKHQHRFAAWAAGRAASVKGCRFKVWQGKNLLEDIGLNEVASSIENLPQADDFDAMHCEWRKNIINNAQNYKDKQGDALKFTHGVAAKLINIYLKSIYVCSGNHNDPRIKVIHPPIDSILLDALYKQNIGDRCEDWQAARRVRWSNLDSNQYQGVITAIKDIIPDGAGLWQVEKYWRGYQ